MTDEEQIRLNKALNRLEEINARRRIDRLKPKSKWMSRKLFIMLVGGILATINNRFQIMPADDLQKLIMLAMSYLIGQSAVDMMDKKK